MPALGFPLALPYLNYTYARGGAAAFTSNTLTVESGTVGSDLTDFVLRVDMGTLGDTFWQDVDSDGGNIRIYDSGMTQLPMDITHIDVPSRTGEMFFKADLLSASDNDFTLMLDGDGVPAADGGLGQEEVWSDYLFAAVFSDLINRVDSSSLTVTGTQGTSLPNWFNADDAAHIVVPDLTQDTTHTMGASFRLDTVSGGNQTCVSWGDNNLHRVTIAADNGSGEIDLWDLSNNLISSGVSPAVDTTYRAVSRYNGTTARHLTVNGTTTATDLTITAKPSAAAPDLYIGVEDGSLSERLHGKVNYVYVRGDVLSDDWLAAEWESWHTTGFIVIS